MRLFTRQRARVLYLYGTERRWFYYFLGFRLPFSTRRK